ncbi:MAG: DUF2309 domain-containing protein [Sphingomonadaceae bacterium]
MLKTFAIEPVQLDQAIRAASLLVPPAFPLAATVAVNPFVGQAGEDLATAAERLARVCPERMTMPRAWFAEQIADGRIAAGDLEAALVACRHPDRPADVAALIEEAGSEPRRFRPIATVAELAAEETGVDWPAILADRIGHFAGQWFDAGQALWPLGDRGGPWATFRALAAQDLSLEILGLPGICAEVAEWPLTARDTIAEAVRRLMIPEAALEGVFHRLFTTLGGWAQLARARGFEAERAGGEDATQEGFLAIALFHEAALFTRYREAIGDRWEGALAAHAAPVVPSRAAVVDSILQEAADRASAREVAQLLAQPVTQPCVGRPRAQVAFCIDVRSEPFRRALEAVCPDVETRGFAGFFGLPLRHRGFASDEAEARLPVLLEPAVETVAGGATVAVADARARIAARAKRAWGRFKLAAVSSFAFVEAAGPIYFGRLFRDSLRTARPARVEPAPVAPELPYSARVEAAAKILGAMSLTSGFAPLVLLVGHGADVVNNPMASALQCGACGGHAGDVNARLLAALLNEPDVRAGLAQSGITIPKDTRFLGGLHETVTDTVRLFDVEGDGDPRVRELEADLAAAGRLARANRAPALPRATTGDALMTRGADWAEVRPEWGLAGARAFIAAPRAITAGRNLEGRAFLHCYDWTRDQGFAVLELIITAPVVVASWISLQYYGSSVAPGHFGAGNKLLHNVVGGIGVLEGNGGPLRTGLAWQSVADAEALVHEPLRLAVMIAAPPSAVADILERHPGVAQLFDNGWLQLLLLDDRGQVIARREQGGFVSIRNLEQVPA